MKRKTSDTCIHVPTDEGFKTIQELQIYLNFCEKIIYENNSEEPGFIIDFNIDDYKPSELLKKLSNFKKVKVVSGLNCKGKYGNV